jgi:hypothetical protein
VPLEELRTMHVGAVVADIDLAVADHRRLGVDPWVCSAELRFRTYDGERRQVVEQAVRMAYGALPGGGSIELVEPDEATPESPQRRLLAAGPGVTHVAYWCDEVLAVADPLLGDGATVFTASVGPDHDRLDLDDPRAVLAAAGAAYLRLPSGALVELVAAAVAPSLVSMLGPEVTGVVPPPPGGAWS